MAIKHTFTSAVEDGADETLVRPVDWNADHEGTATPDPHKTSHDYLGADELSPISLMSQRAVPIIPKVWTDINGFTAAHTGTGSFTTGLLLGNLQTGTTNGSEGCIYDTAGFWQAYAGYGYSWGTKVSIRQGTTQIIGIGFFATPANIDLLPPTNTTHQNHVGFIVDASGNLWASSGNASNETQTDTGIDISGQYDLILSIYGNNVGLYFYVDHVLKATHLLASSYYPNAVVCYYTMYLKTLTEANRAMFCYPLSMFPQFAY